MTAEEFLEIQQLGDKLGLENEFLSSVLIEANLLFCCFFSGGEVLYEFNNLQ